MSAQTVLDGEAAVRAAVGHDLGASAWFELTDDRLRHFAEATGDSTATYLAVSLSNMFLPQIMEVRGFAMGINYGTEAVRLGPRPQAGDRLRGRATLVAVRDVNGGLQTEIAITVESESGGRSCTIESLSRWLRAS